jgi:hypothetical protein
MTPFRDHSVSSLKLLMFIIFSVLFFGAVTYKIILVSNGPVHEYDDHILFAVKMVQEGRVVLPHFLFQLLIIVHHFVLGVLHLPTHQITGINNTITYDWGFSALVVMLEVYVGIELLLIYHLQSRLRNNFRNFENMAYLIAFCVSICSPLFLLAPVDGLFYLGYITPSTIYIIPTQVLLKLPSLALFFLTPFAFNKRNDNTKLLVIIAFLVLLSGLSKPNWLLVMLPALGVVSIIHIFRGYYINWRVIGVLLLSSAAVLGWQYYFKFLDTSSPIYKSTIVITTPFEVWAHYSDYITSKIILSILFPAYVAGFFWKFAKEDFLFKYGWLLFLIGLVYTGFLGESPRKWAGNFIWCGQIACFMLFVSSASLFFSKCFIDYPTNRKRVNCGLAIFCAHVVCGLIYYFRSFESSFG